MAYAPRALAMSRTRLMAELDDGRGYGSSRAASASEALVADVSGQVDVEQARNSGQHRCRADARRAVATTALRAELCGPAHDTNSRIHGWQALAAANIGTSSNRVG